MNLTELQRKLIAAARATPVSDRVPYAFEKRVLALIATQPVADFWGVWAGALWRAAAPCVAIMLLLAAWAAFAPGTNAPSSDLSQEFENTLLAAADQDQPADTVR
jgi:hypothetical protein